MSGLDVAFAAPRHPSLSDQGGQLAGLLVVHGRFVHDRLRLSHIPHHLVHRLRYLHPQNPRRLQRVKVHRIHHVHDLCHLACLCSHLLQVSGRRITFKSNAFNLSTLAIFTKVILKDATELKSRRLPRIQCSSRN